MPKKKTGCRVRESGVQRSDVDLGDRKYAFVEYMRAADYVDDEWSELEKYTLVRERWCITLWFTKCAVWFGNEQRARKCTDTPQEAKDWVAEQITQGEE